MTRQLGCNRTSILLSNLAAAGRISVTLARERCGHSRALPLAGLIAEY